MFISLATIQNANFQSGPSKQITNKKSLYIPPESEWQELRNQIELLAVERVVIHQALDEFNIFIFYFLRKHRSKEHECKQARNHQEAIEVSE